MTAWMLYSVLVGALMGGAGLAAERSCRLLGLPVRWVWLTAVIATVAVSLIGLARTQATAEPELAPVTAMVVDRPDAAGAGSAGYLAHALDMLTRAGRDALAIFSAVTSRTYRAVSGRSPGGLSAALAAAWALASTCLLLAMAATLLRLRGARARWLTHRIADVSVLVSRQTGPALIGLLRPVIVVPAWLLAEAPERQRLVVQHEDEHRAAGDHALLAAAALAVCLLPWNIALWWMLGRTRLAAELDCDARVLRRGAAAGSYGAVLLDVAGRMHAGPLGVPALAGSRTHLERRLLAMTEKPGTPKRTGAAAAAACALLLVVTACAADLPTGAAIEQMDVEQAQQQAEKTGLLPQMAGRAPLFIIDGVATTEEAARALDPARIRSIEVLKAEAARSAYGERGADGVVLVATMSADTARVQPLRSRDATSTVVRSGRLELRAKSLQMHDIPAGEAKPLIVVDGVIAEESFSLSGLDAGSILSVEIVKGPAARVLYEDPRAANGVILIRTRKAADGGR